MSNRTQPRHSRASQSTERPRHSRTPRPTEQPRHSRASQSTEQPQHSRAPRPTERPRRPRAPQPTEPLAILGNIVEALINVPMPVKIGGGVLLASVLVFALASRLPSCSDSVESASEIEQPLDDASVDLVQESAQYELSTAALESVSESPSAADLYCFTLSGLTDPSLSEDQASSIGQAIEACEALGDVGFVLLNVETGKALSYNMDESIYGASTFKAHYALYVCETQVDAGTTTLGSVSNLITNAIVYSDNISFGVLRGMFDSAGFNDWIDAIGATEAEYDPNSWFPWYSARSSAELWIEMFNYLETGSGNAQFLEENLSSTETSFIRDALEGSDAIVLNKAGWCSDYDPIYNSTSDAGIVIIDGQAYIVSIMTGMPDTGMETEGGAAPENRALFESLAQAVFNARSALDLQMVPQPEA